MFELLKQLELLFSKDECSPDGPALKDFLKSNEICFGFTYAKFEFGDSEYQIRLANNGKYYLALYSCGVYEDLYLLTKEQAIEVTKTLAEQVFA